MFRFEELEIWRLAIEYADYLYSTSQGFPAEERYNLSDQLKRSALSISSNIAEGSGASTDKSFRAYLDIAVSSLFETASLLYFAVKRGYINETVRSQCYERSEMLVKKIRAFKNSLKP